MSKRAFAVHAAADELLLRQLRVDLRAAGIELITFENLVRPGTDFAAQIETVMRNSPVVIVVISRSTANRPWVSAEVSLALAQQQTSPKLIIPVLIERDAELPFFLKNLQYIDMSTPEKYRVALDHLVGAILSWQESGESPATWREARQRLLEAEERTFKEAVAHAIDYRRDRTLFLTSGLAVLAGALAAIFAGLVATGALSANTFNHTALLIFASGVLSGTVATALFTLARYRRRG